MNILVTGAGGFIGYQLVKKLRSQKHFVRGVDVKQPEFAPTDANEFWLMDLRNPHNASQSMIGMDRVFHLAADMGGMGHIFAHQAEIIRNNTQIDINVLEAARITGIQRLLYSSSACVYPVHKQDSLEDATLLVEEDAYPANPQGAYGWEKLHTEHLCEYYRKANWLDTQIVRFNNIYGSYGTWRGGREKAPAALSRKVAVAKMTENYRVGVWGDGKAIRNYVYIEDCIEGLIRLMSSGFPGPIHFGNDQSISVDGLVDVIADIAGIEVEKVHVEGPEGVRNRQSDNTLCEDILNWKPTIPVQAGMVFTYEWIEQQVKEHPELA